MKPTKRVKILLAMVASLSLMTGLTATPAAAQGAGAIEFTGRAFL